MENIAFEKFGQYILLEKLAAGGMAEVFLAKKVGASGVQKFVALKRILPQFSESEDFIQMFKEEAKIAVNLSHSNVVSIFEFGVESHQFYLVMEYVEGRNLRQVLNKMKKLGQNFSTSQIVYMMKQVAAGLDHAHRCLDGSTGKPLNIIHRDMSPQNIMVSFEGETKIVDFGIAKASNQIETTKAGTLKGKFGYMSPEQAEGLTVDYRTDIFSLGTVLWELLANDRLFLMNNEINTLKKIRDCKIPSLRKINPNIPVELEKIVMKSLARDKNLRYQNSSEFQRDLNRFLNRHDPDFSAQDFSVYVRTLFSQEILESRKRLIHYSQYQPTSEERTVAMGQSQARSIESKTADLEGLVKKTTYFEETNEDRATSEFNKSKSPSNGPELNMDFQPQTETDYNSQHNGQKPASAATPGSQSDLQVDSKSKGSLSKEISNVARANPSESLKEFSFNIQTPNQAHRPSNLGSTPALKDELSFQQDFQLERSRTNIKIPKSKKSGSSLSLSWVSNILILSILSMAGYYLVSTDKKISLAFHSKLCDLVALRSSCAKSVDYRTQKTELSSSFSQVEIVTLQKGTLLFIEGSYVGRDSAQVKVKANTPLKVSVVLPGSSEKIERIVTVKPGETEKVEF